MSAPTRSVEIAPLLSGEYFCNRLGPGIYMNVWVSFLQSLVATFCRPYQLQKIQANMRLKNIVNFS